MNILGIDQSYTSTGIVVINEKHSLIHSEILSSNKEKDVFNRAWDISNYLNSVANKFNPQYIGLEGLAFGMQGNATRDLAGLQFAIIICLQIINKWDVSIIAPNTVKKTATGKGNSKKDKMLEFLPKDIHKKFLDLGVKKTTGLLDLNDAYWVAITILNRLQNEES